MIFMSSDSKRMEEIPYFKVPIRAIMWFKMLPETILYYTYNVINIIFTLYFCFPEGVPLIKIFTLNCDL